MSFKSIYYTLVLTTLFSSCGNLENKVTTLEKIGLNGDIKSIEEKSYLAIEKFGDIEIGFRAIEYPWLKDYDIIFNSHGNATEKNWYNLQNKLTGKSLILYDKSFNQNENNYYSPDGSLISKTFLKYDLNKNNIESITYDKNGIVLNIISTDYNKFNQTIEEKFIDSTGSVLSKSIYAYDSNNNQIEHISYSKGQFEDKRLMTYNHKNQLISTTVYDIANNITARRIQKYNENNLLQETNDFDNNMKLTRREVYNYDLQNNWNKKIVYDGFSPKYLIIRKIEYRK